MSRPSRHQDQLLVETAKRMYPQVGASGMSLKRIADEAGVNLGMFSYHFGSKANFVRRVLEELVEEAGLNATVQVPEGMRPLDRLRCYLLQLGRNYRDHRQLALAIYRDFLNQDPDVTGYLIEVSERQVAELVPLVEACQQDGSVDAQLAMPQIIGFCMGTVKTPTVIAASQECKPGQELPGRSGLMQQGLARLLTDESIAQRVELALRGIARPQH